MKIGNWESGKSFLIIGGPCAIESKNQLFDTAKGIIKNIDILRAGAFKPRTKPGNFEGLKEEGLKMLFEVGRELDVPTITEVIDTKDIELVAQYADVIQIGARNMQNYELLKVAGKSKKPVLLKRGFGCTVDEWVSAAQYITNEGNPEVILCERGIRTFDSTNRFTLDLAGALVAKQKSGLLVIIDPSHATGRPELIAPLTRAAKAAGLDGVIIEVHCDPNTALCDKDQALTPKEFNAIIELLVQ